MMEYDKTPEEIAIKIDDMVWSYSRVNVSDTCMYGFYLSYINEDKGVENAFSQFGTINHQTFEKYLKRELNVFNVSEYYQDHYYDIVTFDFPKNAYCDLGEKKYNAGLKYFQQLDFDFDKYEVLGVEKEYFFKVGDYNFKGYIDALFRDRETGDIIICDHKTTSFKYLKNGKISKTNLKQFDHYKKQEYLYAIPVIEEYGRVDYLSWNMICDQREIKIPFDKNEFEETKQWVISQIEKIKSEVLWLPDNSDPYFCNVICNHRGTCPYRPIG